MPFGPLPFELGLTVETNPGWSPLHEAACKGYLDVCKMLIKSGAEVNVHGYCDETPLHDAAFNNHPKVSHPA